MSEPKPKRKIPPEEWIPHPPNDSSDYLDGEPPRYEEADPSQQPEDERDE